MAVKVIVPTPLRQYAGKRDSVEVEGKTVAEALAGLTSQYGDLRRHLFTDDGKIRSFVNVYLNDQDIRYLAKDQTPLKENDVISIVPSIAGGLQSPAGKINRPAASSSPLRCICS
ncbi:MAG TPA: MoaD/ThiS family protein [Terriglobia bacterium]|nr:MoaD/ThiS family protein [Terriglobia bacterium]